MKCRMGFKISFDLLQNSKRKWKEKQRKGNKGKETTIQIKIKHIINGIESLI